MIKTWEKEEEKEEEEENYNQNILYKKPIFNKKGQSYELMIKRLIANTERRMMYTRRKFIEK